MYASKHELYPTVGFKRESVIFNEESDKVSSPKLSPVIAVNIIPTAIVPLTTFSSNLITPCSFILLIENILLFNLFAFSYFSDIDKNTINFITP